MKNKIKKILDKKGVALETTIKFIIGIVFLVLIIFALVQTGLLTSFKEQLVVMICTFSTYSRNTLISVIWAFTKTMIAATIVLSLLTSRKGAINLMKKTSVSFIKRIAQQIAVYGLGVGALAGGTSLFLSLATIIIVFSAIPLMCPALTLDVGLEARPVETQTFIETVTTRSIDCYNMLGAGEADPTWGLKPNPRICFILETHTKTTDNMKHIFNEGYKIFDESWILGKPPNTKIYLYCEEGTDNFEYEGNDPNDWDNCYVKNSRVYIMFLDRHEYDSLSFGHAACGGQIDVGSTFGDFDPKNDVIVWCVEEI